MVLQMNLIDRAKNKFGIYPKEKLNMKQVKQWWSTGRRAKIYGSEFNPLRDKFRKELSRLDATTVFEFGCNAGYNLLHLKTHANMKVTGVDINQEAVNQAIYNGLEVYHGDEYSLLNYQDNSFDLVFTGSVLDHIPEDNFYKIINHLERMARKYVVLVESNDDLKPDLFAHNYIKQGYTSQWEFFSDKKSGGNDCLYKYYFKEITNDTPL